MSQLMTAAAVASSATAPPTIVGPAAIHMDQSQAQQQHLQQQQQQPHQQQQLLQESQFQQQLFEADDILQQERLSIEAVERGRKSQIMLENMHGSARTDPRSNDIISARALKRWQKQKEIEAAKLGAQLNAQNSGGLSRGLVVSPDFKHAVSNNVPLAGQQTFTHTIRVSRPMAGGKDATVKVEIPDMELQAEGIPETVLDGRTSITDAFMTELFVRDPETGITYRQTQLLQDDPPNPGILEEMEGVAPTHNMVLDTTLDAQFEDGTLHFQDLE
ncbi:uncharacterized protein LOC101859321 [Aplysia californica]|uniref:Uncharacterized protein LOC101859321 n=1 Tax=Aplysia californica TaxID=6500 RepID=A0ABM0JK97_APLCA|nr:uncharacterized protein LOC101859321 [Aplysia californica]